MQNLTTPEEILQQYETRPRALTPEFVKAIPWDQIRRFPLKPEVVPVLLYMRNVEKLTEVYFEELRRTPTGKEWYVKQFMERWNAEEAQHGELLNRFLEAAGVAEDPQWYRSVRREIPFKYTLMNYLNTTLANLFGSNFSAVHMLWGAINEMTTLQGYRQLIRIAEHPVLEELLKGIMQEESIHIHFYFNVGLLKVSESKFSRRLARWLIERYWEPVGSGIRPKDETDTVICTLFSDAAGMESVEKHINRRFGGIPGFQGFEKVSRRIREIIQIDQGLVTRDQGPVFNC